MFHTRWHKVLRDLCINKTRTLLVLLSIAVGVFAIGVIANSRLILSYDLKNSYAAMNPASVKFTTEPFDESLVQAIRGMEEVDEAEGRRIVVVRVKVGIDKWYNMELFAIPDYDHIEVDTITPQSGVWPPSNRELLVERSSLDLIGANVGDTVQVETFDGKQHELRIVGAVHDIHQVPSNLRRRVYGYITLDTLEWLGESRDFNELHVIVAGDRFDEEHIQRVAERVRNKIERNGRTVLRTAVPEPGKHQLDVYIQTMTLILGVLGFLVLLLSGFLVLNTVSALLAQQVRQVGIMKTIGARTYQIVGIYLGMVLIFGLLALVVAVPMGIVGTRALTTYATNLFNFDLVSFGLPLQVFALQVLVSLMVPALAALYPIINGSRITVREAISDYGLGKSGLWADPIGRLLERVHGLSRPLLLSLRNTFRRGGRLASTLITLTLSGAIFIAVFSVRASLLLTLEDIAQYWRYDVEVDFARSYRTRRIEDEALRVPGVVGVESWIYNYTFRLRPDGTESRTEITIVAPSATTDLIRPSVLQGRWLLPEDENAVVVNSDLLRDEPDIKVGDEIVLKIRERETTWCVVGVVTGQLMGPMVYVNYPYFARLCSDVGQANYLLVETQQHDAEFQIQVAKALEGRFRRLGLNVALVETNAEIRTGVNSLFNIIVVFLSVMAILLTIVGGLGLMGTMSLNVIERTREIGIMRAIGASDDAVMRIVIVEGVLIGILAWLLGSMLALPLSKFLSNQVGLSFLNAPLSYTFSVNGAIFWLVTVVILSALASLWPALRATKISVREALAYE